MKIECKQCSSCDDWECISVHDNPHTGYAHNIYHCSCGTILKQDVWKNAGLTWILENGEVIRETK